MVPQLSYSNCYKELCLFYVTYLYLSFCLLAAPFKSIQSFCKYGRLARILHSKAQSADNVFLVILSRACRCALQSIALVTFHTQGAQQTCHNRNTYCEGWESFEENLRSMHTLPFPHPGSRAKGKYHI
eukprot:1634060-Amphidinium_carterae.1